MYHFNVINTLQRVSHTSVYLTLIKALLEGELIHPQLWMRQVKAELEVRPGNLVADVMQLSSSLVWLLLVCDNYFPILAAVIVPAHVVYFSNSCWCTKTLVRRKYVSTLRKCNYLSQFLFLILFVSDKMKRVHFGVCVCMHF